MGKKERLEFYKKLRQIKEPEPKTFKDAFKQFCWDWYFKDYFIELKEKNTDASNL